MVADGAATDVAAAATSASVGGHDNRKPAGILVRSCYALLWPAGRYFGSENERVSKFDRLRQRRVSKSGAGPFLGAGGVIFCCCLLIFMTTMVNKRRHPKKAGRTGRRRSGSGRHGCVAENQSSRGA